MLAKIKANHNEIGGIYIKLTSLREFHSTRILADRTHCTSVLQHGSTAVWCYCFARSGLRALRFFSFYTFYFILFFIPLFLFYLRLLSASPRARFANPAGQNKNSTNYNKT